MFHVEEQRRTQQEPFVAGTILRRPEPTKVTVEPMIISIIAIAITFDHVHSSVAATNSTLYVA